MTLGAAVSNPHGGGRVLMVGLSSSRWELSRAAALVTKQAFLGIALLSPDGEGARKGGLNIAYLTSPCQHAAADWAFNLRSKKENAEA